MNTQQQSILSQALTLAPFDGWTMQMLMEATEKAGLDRNFAHIAFPNGVKEAVSLFLEDMDRHMLERVNAGEKSFQSLKIRQRIATAIRARLELYAPIKPLIRRTVSFLSMPQNADLAVTSLWRTADAIWHAAGDQATDFNYYSKRTLLAGVYTATLLYWLNDESADYQDSWEFLDRRIEEVMGIGKLKGKIAEYCEDIQRFFQGK